MEGANELSVAAEVVGSAVIARVFADLVFELYWRDTPVSPAKLSLNRLLPLPNCTGTVRPSSRTGAIGRKPNLPETPIEAPIYYSTVLLTGAA